MGWMIELIEAKQGHSSPKTWNTNTHPTKVIRFGGENAAEMNQ
jgi:hypothetical protein